MLRISVRTPSAFVCLPAISHFSIALSEKMPQSSKHTAGIEGDRERSAVNHQTFHWGSFLFPENWFTGQRISWIFGAPFSQKNASNSNGLVVWAPKVATFYHNNVKHTKWDSVLNFRLSRKQRKVNVRVALTLFSASDFRNDNRIFSLVIT